MLKYKVKINRKWGVEAKIVPVEIDRETEFSVWIKGSRNAKVSEYANYYDTWEDAKKALLACQKECTDVLRARYKDAKAILGDIKGMKK